MKHTKVFFNIIVLAVITSSTALFAVDKVAAPASTPAPQKSKMFAEPITGKVIEKIDAANYTYLKVQTDKEQTWLAVPQVNIALNTQVEMQKPAPMFGFESKTLKRKFDKIYFGLLTSQKNEMHKNDLKK